MELWRSDDLNKVINIHAGERVILKADRQPTKIKINLAKGLTQQIQGPFRVLHKYWSLQPMSDETKTALTIQIDTSSETKVGEKFCTNCGSTIPSDLKFCTHCGQKLESPK